MTTTRPPLVLPSDPLDACRVLCDALVALGPIVDEDGMVADRVRQAHARLVRARGAYQACLPRRGDDWIVDVDTGRWTHVNDQGDKGCASCARIKGPDGRTPFYSETRTPSSRLCGACENVTRQRKDQWRQEHPPRCEHCSTLVGTDAAAEACPGPAGRQDPKGFAARLASALAGPDLRPHRWRDQPPPVDPRRFWPPAGFLEHLRDRGHVRATPAQWAGWYAAEKATEAKKRKRSA